MSEAEEQAATISRSTKFTLGGLAIFVAFLATAGGFLRDFAMTIDKKLDAQGDEFVTLRDRLKGLEVNQIVQGQAIEKMDKRLSELPSRQEYETIVRSEVQALRLEFMREMMNRERRSDEERKPPK